MPADSFEGRFSQMLPPKPPDEMGMMLLKAMLCLMLFAECCMADYTEAMSEHLEFCRRSKSSYADVLSELHKGRKQTH